ncbi:MAG: hypothetical protein ABR499_22785 [Gemmatimonadaceae bacterium]
MLAHQPERPLQLPRPEGVDELRRVVRQFLLNGPSSTPDEAWRRLARRMCEDARAREVHVEELLIGLKRTWATVADAERVPRDQSPRLLARLVTLCVKEFYGPLD